MIKKILRGVKIATKITAITAAVSGAVSAVFSTSSAGSYAGIALSASGVGTCVVMNGPPVKSYDKTPHVPPCPRPKALKRDMQHLSFAPEKTPKATLASSRKRRVGRGLAEED